MTYHDAFDFLHPDASIANNAKAKKIDNGLWHQSTGNCKSEKCEKRLEKLFGLKEKAGVGHLCSDLPIDYSARLTPNRQASIEERCVDMKNNDLVKVQTIRAVLLGDSDYTTTACSQ